MRYQLSIIQVPRKHLTTADTLFRAPVYEPLLKDSSFEEDYALYVNNLIQALPASEHLEKPDQTICSGAYSSTRSTAQRQQSNYPSFRAIKCPGETA